jgi:hypothetical protein
VAARRPARRQTLGRRSRGPDHRQAADLVEQITPGGKDAAKALRRLIDMKDEAQYGFYDVSGPQLKTAVRQAASLVKFADAVLRR